MSMKDHNDLQPAFEFVKENKFLLSGDEDLGIFTNDPSKLLLLPGHKRIMDNFIKNVKSSKKKSICEQPSKKKKRLKTSTERSKEILEKANQESILLTLSKKMEIWFSLVPDADILAEKLKFSSPMQTVQFEILKSPLQGSMPTPIFTCQVCKAKLTITKCKLKDVYKLSNAQRHINKTCWVAKSRANFSGKTQNLKPYFFYPESFQQDSSSSSSSTLSVSLTQSDSSTVIVSDESDDFTCQTTPFIVAQDVVGDTEVSFAVANLSHKKMKFNNCMPRRKRKLEK